MKILSSILIFLPLGILFAQAPKSIKDEPISKQKFIFHELDSPKIIRMKSGRSIFIFTDPPLPLTHKNSNYALSVIKVVSQFEI